MADIAPVSGIMDGALIADQTFILERRDQYSRAANGSVYAAELGGPVWKASYTTKPMYHRKALAFQAKLNTLRGSIVPFKSWDFRAELPAAYQSGMNLSAVVLSGIGFDRDVIDMTGLPANFTATQGDYFAITYGAAPYRYLGQFVETKTASGAGAMSSIRVYPPIPTPAVTGGAVTLIRADANFRMEPGTLSQSIQGGMFTVISFDAVQSF